MYKADIDAAFRRIPLKPDHRQFANIVLLHEVFAMVVEHVCSPFGSVASVHNWDRIGRLVIMHHRETHSPFATFAVCR